MAEFHLRDQLVCPLHRTPLTIHASTLKCDNSCEYPLFGDVPFLLPAKIDHTSARAAAASFQLAAELKSGNLNFDTTTDIDPVVQDQVAATNSNLYKPLIGRLTSYPIPHFPMQPQTASPVLLDIGCGWGRWCIAAANSGFVPVGVDPSLKLALSAQRVARQLGIKASYVVADSRYLPFKTGTFDAAFSFSVLQHFSKPDVVKTLHALASVMKNGASTKLHLMNRLGLRSLYVQMRRGWRHARDFEVRYWLPSEALRAFASVLGPSRIEIDGFFVQARVEDRQMLLPHHRAILDISRSVTELSKVWPPLTNFADNFYVISKIANPRPLV